MKSDEYIPHLTDGDTEIQRGLVIFLKSCKELVVHLEFKTCISVTPETILLMIEGIRMIQMKFKSDLLYEKIGSGQATPLFQEFPPILPKSQCIQTYHPIGTGLC